MLSKEQIQIEVEKASHKLVNSDGYKNLKSPIEVECSRGHTYVTSVDALRRSTVCPSCSREIVKLEGYPPPKRGHRVVSIDQATNVSGISVFDDGELVYVGQRIFNGELGQRYASFSSFLSKEVIGQWKPDELIFEDIQYQNNVITFKVLAGLLGICTLLAELGKVKYTIIPNKVWQSRFDIRGTTRVQQKRATMDKVKEHFNLNVNDDIADSIMLGYYHILNTGHKLF